MRWPVAGLLVAVAGCGAAACGSAEEEAQPVAPPSALTAAAAGTDAPATSTPDVSEPPAQSGPPTLTVGGTGVAWGEPRPEPVVDAPDCVARWNAAANATARAEAVRQGARGAFVDLRFDGKPRCALWLTAGGGLIAFAESAASSFGQMGGGASGPTRPPDWVLRADGTIGGPYDPPPPRATFGSGGTVATAGTATFCWDEGSGSRMCADAPAPTCGDGLTPRLDVAAGDPVGLTLAFEPDEAPVLAVHGADGQPVGAAVELERTASPAWVAEVAEGEHAISVFVRAPGGQDVTYTACLHVLAPAGVPTAGEPLARVPAASLHRAGVKAHPAGDEATCVRRWNDEANVARRAEVAAVDHGGAFVRAAIAGIPTCAVYVLRPGAEETTADVYVQRDAGAFGLAASGTGLLRPAEWWLDDEARLQPTLPEPPPAAVRTPDGSAVAGFGTYCWSTAGCVDKVGPACGDGWTPSVFARTGGPLRFTLPFTPPEAPVLTVHDGSGGGEQVTLEAAAPVWRVDLPRGRHAVSLFVRGPEGGDVAYAVCLDVLR